MRGVLVTRPATRRLVAALASVAGTAALSLAAVAGAPGGCSNREAPAARPTSRPTPEPGRERPRDTEDIDMTKPTDTGKPTDAGEPATPSAAASAADVTALAGELLKLGYRELFLRMTHDAADALWARNRAAFDALVRDEGQDAQARFLAAEVLFLHVPEFPPAALRPVLAPLYAEALAQTGRNTGTWRLMANQWGLLYAGDDTGALGPHLLALGSDAVAALRPLLHNDEPVVYEGSRDATTGNRRGYRIKDIAAYYLGRLTGEPVAFHDDLAARDREIARLARSLP